MRVNPQVTWAAIEKKSIFKRKIEKKFSLSQKTRVLLVPVSIVVLAQITIENETLNTCGTLTERFFSFLKQDKSSDHHITPRHQKM